MLQRESPCVNTLDAARNAAKAPSVSFPNRLFTGACGVSLRRHAAGGGLEAVAG